MTASLMRSDTKALYNLEKLGDVMNPLEAEVVVVPATGTLTGVGWAVDGANKAAAGGVDVAVDGRPHRAESGRERPDVGQHFNIRAYDSSGFIFYLPVAKLGPGVHKLTMRVVSHDGKTYSEGLPVRLEIR
ncbi:MAG: hypothetical protein NTW28_27650 [Candidatus Solibacter sp.]|nr:hypothetical protein [Candidatus Solibacter sp.]